jgi:hypothetical protein
MQHESGATAPAGLPRSAGGWRSRFAAWHNRHPLALVAALLVALLLLVALGPWLAPAPATLADPADDAPATPATPDRAAAEAIEPTEPTAPDAPDPADDAPQEIRFERPSLVERLDPDTRAALRREGQRLRATPAAAAASAPPTQVWALVTAPLGKRQSERVSAQLKAVALFQPLPMHVELMPTRAGPRAVFWPFVSAQDAEKVRQALADRGLQTEAVAF